MGDQIKTRLFLVFVVVLSVFKGSSGGRPTKNKVCFLGTIKDAGAIRSLSD